MLYLSLGFSVLILVLPLNNVVSELHDIEPFQVIYDGDDFRLLQKRLRSTKFPDPAPGTVKHDWSYGIPLDIIKNLSEYLQTDFDWSAHVQKLNTMPQFKARLGNNTIHFMHQRSSYDKAKPLMIIHGWPGSFWECQRILPMLTEPHNYGGKREHSFHVVCPSIPGFGYSSKPTRRGFDQMACAKVFSELMSVLGYERYFVQGGDWGSVIASLQASLPESAMRVLGLHLNMVPAAPPVMKGIVAAAGLWASAVMPWLFYSAEERAGLMQVPLAALEHTGYFLEQSTTPQTLSYGLSDSPVGLLAWITEKFYHWSDNGGDLFSWISPDELLTNFMIYWTTNTAGSSTRFYYELWHNSPSSLEHLLVMEIGVPTAMALFPKEIPVFLPVRHWANAYYKDIVLWNRMPRGGHFAALEEPLLLAKELWKFQSTILARRRGNSELQDVEF